MYQYLSTGDIFNTFRSKPLAPAPSLFNTLLACMVYSYSAHSLNIIIFIVQLVIKMKIIPLGIKPLIASAQVQPKFVVYLHATYHYPRA